MIALSQALQDRISPEPNTGCWLWTGYTVPHGYGYFAGDPAHRLVYQTLRGEIASGLDLDHLCRVRCCVNPDHLEPVTRKENLRRGIQNTGESSKDRARLQTHCKRGHEYNWQTTLRTSAGRRTCRECARLRMNPGPRQRTSKYSDLRSKEEKMRLTR